MSWYLDPITPRQLVAIEFIQEYLGIEFTGEPTKGGAGAFIGEYYQRAKDHRDMTSVQGMTNQQAVASLKQQKLLEEQDPWSV